MNSTCWYFTHLASLFQRSPRPVCKGKLPFSSGTDLYYYPHVQGMKMKCICDFFFLQKHCWIAMDSLYRSLYSVNGFFLGVCYISASEQVTSNMWGYQWYTKQQQVILDVHIRLQPGVCFCLFHFTMALTLLSSKLLFLYFQLTSHLSSNKDNLSSVHNL